MYRKQVPASSTSRGLTTPHAVTRNFHSLTWQSNTQSPKAEDAIRLHAIAEKHVAYMRLLGVAGSCQKCSHSNVPAGRCPLPPL